jgi:hypothetical protein
VLAAGSVHVPACGCTILGVRYHVHVLNVDILDTRVHYEPCTDDDCTREHVDDHFEHFVATGDYGFSYDHGRIATPDIDAPA